MAKPSRAYRAPNGRMILRGAGGRFRQSTLRDIGVPDAAIAPASGCICSACGRTWHPILKKDLCDDCEVVPRERPVPKWAVRQSKVPGGQHAAVVVAGFAIFLCGPASDGESLRQAEALMQALSSMPGVPAEGVKVDTVLRGGEFWSLVDEISGKAMVALAAPRGEREFIERHMDVIAGAVTPYV
ncbi:MAG: hypothetical protein VR70_10865 [Rhodospirillaceae bacterium BRH_c57]|nr:MAG: hypothetical protein VR70_10865 [Rhodospirillaceae bacterium BRH_c57]